MGDPRASLDPMTCSLDELVKFLDHRIERRLGIIAERQRTQRTHLRLVPPDTSGQGDDAQ